MKTIRILALHLAYGGVEKAICSMANLFAEKYPTEIISVYELPKAPAYPLDERVKVRYLLTERPNREEWHAAVRAKNPVAIARESCTALKVLWKKKQAVRRVVREIHDGVLITTRHEDNLVSSRLGDPKVWRIAQFHHDHRFQKTYIEGFRKGYGGIDVLAMLTPGLAEEARQWVPAGSKTRVMVVPNFLEHFPEPFSLDDKEKTVLAVGRLDPVKGFDRLIRCFAEVRRQRPDWTLRIVGDGAEGEHLRSLIRELGLEAAVTLTGRLDPGEVEAEMKRASLYAMSSNSEGFPFVLLEAQSCGLPVVAYDVRVGPAAVVTDGVDGYLVPDGEQERFAARLVELMDDAPKRRAMAEAALSSAQAFSREKVAEIWEEALNG